MGDVFVDTWAWYALSDTANEDHAVAYLANEELLSEGQRLVTTNFVLGEALTLMRYHLGHAAAVSLGQMVRGFANAGLVRLIRVEESQEAAAWEIFEKYDDQKFSYTDCTSFAVMRALRLQVAFTGDRHFAVMGFTVFPGA